MRKFIVAAMVLGAAAVSTAMPAWSSASGTVNAHVTVASPCVTVSPDGLDFGVLGLTQSNQSPTDSGQLNIVASNCGGGSENILARGTDAVSASGPAKWLLAPGHFIGATCPDPNIYKTVLNVIINNAGAQYALDSVDQTIASPVGPNQSPDIKAIVRMPCAGSDGAG